MILSSEVAGQAVSWLVSNLIKRRRPADQYEVPDNVLIEPVLPKQRDLLAGEPHQQCPQLDWYKQGGFV